MGNDLETTAESFALHAFLNACLTYMLGLNQTITQRLSPTSIKWVIISQMTIIGQCGSCGCGVLSIIFECQQCIYLALKILRFIDNPKFLMSTQNGALVIPFLFKSAKSFFFTPTTDFFSYPIQTTKLIVMCRGTQTQVPYLLLNYFMHFLLSA